MALSCAECWAVVPRGSDNCVRCGAKFTGETLKVGGLFKAYPWLGFLLAGSFCLTFWALTRRPPPAPEDEIPPAVEPVASAEAEQAPAELPPPVFTFPPADAAAAVVEAPAPVVHQTYQPLRQASNGAWSGGVTPVVPK